MKWSNANNNTIYTNCIIQFTIVIVQIIRIYKLQFVQLLIQIIET